MGARGPIRGFPVLRLAACVLLSAITADFAADTWCHKGWSSSISATAVRAAGAGQRQAGEPGTPLCVPDCFCCSRSETASPALTLPPLPALAQAPSPDPASVPAVVRPVAEPPPLALS